MPGPQDPSDQAADAYERGYDAPRRADLGTAPADRPARGSQAELRQHLERLPAGHPSSPYHDDGSRKPPVVRLKDLELPLSDDAAPGETEAQAREDEAERHGTYEDDVHAGNPYASEARLTETDWVGWHQSETYTTGNHRRETSLPEASLPQASLGETGQRETSPPETSLPDTGQRETSDHETGEHETGEHQTGEHQTGEHQHETGEHETESSAANPYRTDQPDAAENTPSPQVAVDPPRTRADGSWEWKGQRLKSGECKIAEEMLGRCRAAEGRTVFGTYGDTGLTPAMRRVEAQLEHGQLVPDTEKFALKSADRFKEKLAKLIARSPGAEPAELASDVHDSIRYTFLFEASHYTRGVADACQQLTDEGYELIESRPSWDKDEYKGVNSQWRDLATGLFFEVQWHTSESWDAKQKTHVAYEKINDKRTPIAEVERLRAYQREVSAMIAVPPGALQIRPYKKES